MKIASLLRLAPFGLLVPALVAADVPTSNGNTNPKDGSMTMYIVVAAVVVVAIVVFIVAKKKK